MSLWHGTFFKLFLRLPREGLWRQEKSCPLPQGIGDALHLLRRGLPVKLQAHQSVSIAQQLGVCRGAILQHEAPCLLRAPGGCLLLPHGSLPMG